MNDTMSELRHDWTREEVASIYNTPIMELIYRGASVHRRYHDPSEVQVCTLLSIKAGGCAEARSFYPQGGRYHTDVAVYRLHYVEEVLTKAREAKEAGSTRFCMGAAWREVRHNSDFDKVIEIVNGVNAMGMEVCCTL